MTNNPSTTTTIVYILRHGEREDVINPRQWRNNYPDLHPSDPPLAEKGHQQAKAVAERLSKENEPPTIIISSPYIRCVETAVHIANKLNIPIYIEPGFSEVNWSMPPGFMDVAVLKQKFSRIDENYKPVLRRDELRKEYGDSACSDRSAKAAKLVLNQHCKGLKSVLFVGHGASCYGMVEGLSGYGFYQGLTTLTRITENGKVELEGCAKHLKGELGKNLRAY